MNAEERLKELQDEYERLQKVRAEVSEQVLRLEGAILILRELVQPVGEAMPQDEPESA